MLWNPLLRTAKIIISQEIQLDQHGSKQPLPYSGSIQKLLGLLFIMWTNFWDGGQSDLGLYAMESSFAYGQNNYISSQEIQMDQHSSKQPLPYRGSNQTLEEKLYPERFKWTNSFPSKLCETSEAIKQLRRNR